MGGAAVRLISSETGKATLARTDGHGGFGFLALPAGEYRASVRRVWVPVWEGALPLRVEAGEVLDLPLQLRAGTNGASLVAGEGGVRAGEAGAPDGKARLRGSGPGAAPATAANVSAGGGALSELPFAGREWEAVGEVSAAARDTTLAGGGSAQEPNDGEETASAREEHETGSAASGLNLDGLAVTGGRRKRGWFVGGPGLS